MMIVSLNHSIPPPVLPATGFDPAESATYDGETRRESNFHREVGQQPRRFRSCFARHASALILVRIRQSHRKAGSGSARCCTRRAQMRARLIPTSALRASLFVLLICAAALAQQPRIDSVSPLQGPIAGGAVVTIKGANFNGATVTLDGAAIMPLSQSDSEVRLQTPKHDNGYVLIQAGSAAAEFLYVAPALQDLPPGYITT